MMALLVHIPIHLYEQRWDMQYFKPKYISMKASDQFTEKCIQDQITEDPGILGLGDLSLISREKTLPGGGRVNLILGPVNTNQGIGDQGKMNKINKHNVQFVKTGKNPSETF